jgi:hypothetical protein
VGSSVTLVENNRWACHGEVLLPVRILPYMPETMQNNPDSTGKNMHNTASLKDNRFDSFDF